MFKISFNKQNKDPIKFAQYAIETYLIAVSDCLSMKKTIFSVQIGTIQSNHLLKNCIYVKHVISILIKIRFHFGQSAINGFRSYTR